MIPSGNGNKPTAHLRSHPNPGLRRISSARVQSANPSISALSAASDPTAKMLHSAAAADHRFFNTVTLQHPTHITAPPHPYPSHTEVELANAAYHPSHPPPPGVPHTISASAAYAQYSAAATAAAQAITAAYQMDAAAAGVGMDVGSMAHDFAASYMGVDPYTLGSGVGHHARVYAATSPTRHHQARAFGPGVHPPLMSRHHSSPPYGPIATPAPGLTLPDHYSHAAAAAREPSPLEAAAVAAHAWDALGDFSLPQVHHMSPTRKYNLHTRGAATRQQQQHSSAWAYSAGDYGGAFYPAPGPAAAPAPAPAPSSFQAGFEKHNKPGFKDQRDNNNAAREGASFFREPHNGGKGTRPIPAREAYRSMDIGVPSDPSKWAANLKEPGKQASPVRPKQQQDGVYAHNAQSGVKKIVTSPRTYGKIPESLGSPKKVVLDPAVWEGFGFIPAFSVPDTQEVFAEKVFADKVFSEKVFAEKAFTEKVFTEKVDLDVPAVKEKKDEETYMKVDLSKADIILPPEEGKPKVKRNDEEKSTASSTSGTHTQSETNSNEDTTSIRRESTSIAEDHGALLLSENRMSCNGAPFLAVDVEVPDPIAMPTSSDCNSVTHSHSESGVESNPSAVESNPLLPSVLMEEMDITDETWNGFCTDAGPDEECGVTEIKDEAEEAEEEKRTWAAFSNHGDGPVPEAHNGSNGFNYGVYNNTTWGTHNAAYRTNENYGNSSNVDQPYAQAAPAPAPAPEPNHHAQANHHHQKRASEPAAAFVVPHQQSNRDRGSEGKKHQYPNSALRRASTGSMSFNKSDAGSFGGMHRHTSMGFNLYGSHEAQSYGPHTLTRENYWDNAQWRRGAARSKLSREKYELIFRGIYDKDMFLKTEQIDVEDRNSVMMRNIPNGYTQELLMRLLDNYGFGKDYDYFYLPIDFRSGANMGYCFINFMESNRANQFVAYFHGFGEWAFNSDKQCEVTWAVPYQGLAAHIDRYRNSPVMHTCVPDYYKPTIFLDGTQVSFPAPTKALGPLRIRRTSGKKM